jgi:large subunit ribosomal protein L25
MSEITVEVEERATGGRSAARRLRREGRIPAILYGGGREALPVSVRPGDVEQVLHGERGLNTLFHLRLEGKDLRRLVMVKEYQADPISDRIIHADFVRVDEDQMLQLRLSVRLEGTPDGVKNEGGVLDFVNREVNIRCLPKDIPDALHGDVSSLQIGQTLTVGDVEIPEGVEALDVPETVLVTISAPRKIEEPVVAVEEEVAEAAPEEGEEAAAGEEKPEADEKPEKTEG